MPKSVRKIGRYRNHTRQPGKTVWRCCQLLGSFDHFDRFVGPQQTVKDKHLTGYRATSRNGPVTFALQTSKCASPHSSLFLCKAPQHSFLQKMCICRCSTSSRLQKKANTKRAVLQRCHLAGVTAVTPSGEITSAFEVTEKLGVFVLPLPDGLVEAIRFVRAISPFCRGLHRGTCTCILP